jgi:hypothetical protein
MKIRKGLASVAIAVLPLTGAGIALTFASGNSGANAQTIAPDVSGSGGPTPTLTPTPKPTPTEEPVNFFIAFFNWLSYYIDAHDEYPRPPAPYSGCCGIRG